ncbi:MAG: helix-turn-helix domain-containing protein [Parcubacteria group bacterium]
MNSQSIDSPRERIAYSIKETTSLMGLSRSTIYRLATQGKLRIRKIAGRSVVARDDLLRLLD